MTAQGVRDLCARCGHITGKLESNAYFGCLCDECDDATIGKPQEWIKNDWDRVQAELRGER